MSAVADIAVDPAAEVEAELNDVAGHLNAQHGRLVDLTVRLLADKSLWQGPGVWTMAQYLAWRVGVSPHRARQIVTIAERADELPQCVDALRRGELSIDQLTPIAKRAPWWTDTQLSMLARGLTVTQVRRAVGKYDFPYIPNPDAPATAEDGDGVGAVDGADTGTGTGTGTGTAADETAESDVSNATDATAGDGGEPAPRDVCSFLTGDDDRFRLHLETDAHTGMIITTALTEARDKLFLTTSNGNGNDSVDWVDAIREVCERSLDTVTEAARRDRHRIAIHLDTDAVATDVVGWNIPDAVRRHLTCDGVLDPVFTADGTPVSVGRRQRIVPERTRRLVIHRDAGCRVPGCDRHRFLEVHHIIHWLDDGPTDTWNLIALCPKHHRLHHQGRLGITGNADQPDGMTFTFAAGDRIWASGARPKPPGAPPPQPAGIYQHPYGERLDTRWLHFNPPPRNHN